MFDKNIVAQNPSQFLLNGFKKSRVFLKILPDNKTHLILFSTKEHTPMTVSIHASKNSAGLYTINEFYPLSSPTATPIKFACFFYRQYL